MSGNSKPRDFLARLTGNFFSDDDESPSQFENALTEACIKVDYFPHYKHLTMCLYKYVYNDTATSVGGEEANLRKTQTHEQCPRPCHV